MKLEMVANVLRRELTSFQWDGARYYRVSWWTEKGFSTVTRLTMIEARAVFATLIPTQCQGE